jgi:hypothetical protein
MSVSELDELLEDVAASVKQEYADCCGYPSWEIMLQIYEDKPDVLAEILEDFGRYRSGDHYFLNGVWPAKADPLPPIGEVELF